MVGMQRLGSGVGEVDAGTNVGTEINAGGNVGSGSVVDREGGIETAGMGVGRESSDVGDDVGVGIIGVDVAVGAFGVTEDRGTGVDVGDDGTSK